MRDTATRQILYVIFMFSIFNCKSVNAETKKSENEHHNNSEFSAEILELIESSDPQKGMETYRNLGLSLLLILAAERAGSAMISGISANSQQSTIDDINVSLKWAEDFDSIMVDMAQNPKNLHSNLKKLKALLDKNLLFYFTGKIEKFYYGDVYADTAPFKRRLWDPVQSPLQYFAKRDPQQAKIYERILKNLTELQIAVDTAMSKGIFDENVGKGIHERALKVSGVTAHEFQSMISGLSEKTPTPMYRDIEANLQQGDRIKAARAREKYVGETMQLKNWPLRTKIISGVTVLSFTMAIRDYLRLNTSESPLSH